MGENSKIQWTDSTFNSWWGCTEISISCSNCYARRLSKRFGWDLWGPNADRRFMSDTYWEKPLKWNAKAQKAGKRARVFCGSMCDILERHNMDINHKLYVARGRLFQLILDTPWLEWLLLTKRIDNAKRMFPLSWLSETWPKNIRLGVTIVTQEEADRDIPELLKLNVPNFLSIEPMLGPIDLEVALWGGGDQDWQNKGRHSLPANILSVLDHVIVGGETGPGARPMKLDWARSIRNQCKEAGVPFFFKAVSGKGPIPPDLQIRQFPGDEI